MTIACLLTTAFMDPGFIPRQHVGEMDAAEVVGCAPCHRPGKSVKLENLSFSHRQEVSCCRMAGSLQLLQILICAEHHPSATCDDKLAATKDWQCGSPPSCVCDGFSVWKTVCLSPDDALLLCLTNLHPQGDQSTIALNDTQRQLTATAFSSYDNDLCQSLLGHC